jgi:hypothetical protein
LEVDINVEQEVEEGFESLQGLQEAEVKRSLFQSHWEVLKE